MATSLTSLSNELLLQIIEHIPCFSTLGKLSLCSKRFSALVRPRLYASVEFRSPHQSFMRLYAFAHAVLCSPENALYVRHCVPGSWVFPIAFIDKSVRCFPPYADLNFDFLETVVRRYSQSKWETAEWMDDLRHGMEDALLVLVLPALVNLEELELYSPRGEYYEKLLLQAGNRSSSNDSFPCFNSLTTLTVTAPRYPERHTLTSLRPFFTIPSLRRLHTGDVGEARRSSERFTQAMLEADNPMHALLLPHSSGISDIDLNSSKLGPADFEEIFKACKSLRSFKYEHRESSFGNQHFPLSSIVQAMTAAKYSLQELCLESTNIEICMRNLPEEDILIGSLKDYTALKIIRTHPSILLGTACPPAVHLIQILPGSLEQLHLTGYVEYEHVRDVLAEIEEVIAEKASRFPRLCKIICEWPFTGLIRLEDGTFAMAWSPGPPPAVKVKVWYDFIGLQLLAEAEDVSIELGNTNVP